MHIRTPVSPGRFYPARPELLLQQVEACYHHPSGPGPLPGGLLPDTLPLALIVPHGALGHAGPIAAHAYARLANALEQPEADPLRLIVVIGPDHLGLGAPVSGTRLDYASPLGAIPSDQAMLERLCAQAIQGALIPLVADAWTGHQSEHSVENQLPFLQHLQLTLQRQAWRRPDGRSPVQGLRLLPLTMRTQDPATALALGELLDRELPHRECLLVASSDMSHCGPWYGNQPPMGGMNTLSISDWCRQQTAQAVAAIEANQPERLLQGMQAGVLSMCGAGCVAAALDFAQRRGVRRVTTLACSDSVRVAAGWRSCLPADAMGHPRSEWSILETVDPANPVGFASFLLS